MIDRNGSIFGNRLSGSTFTAIIRRLLAHPRIRVVTYKGGDTCALGGCSSTVGAITRVCCRHLRCISGFSGLRSVFFGFNLGLSSRLVPRMRGTLRRTVNSVVIPIRANGNDVSLVVPNMRGTGNLHRLRGL